MAEEGFLERMSHWQASAAEATGVWAERRRLAAAMRTVIDRLIQSDAPEEELAQAADRLEQYAEHLRSHPKSHRYDSWHETSLAGDAHGFFDQSPLIGRANPLAPPIEIEADPDGVHAHGRVVFGAAYEGPPGCVHGGLIAAAFDEVLGFANSLAGEPGMTGTLTIRYRRPTPLHTPLRFAARLDRVEGRKVFTMGEVFASDELCAEAEGIFVRVDREKFRALYEKSKSRASD